MLLTPWISLLAWFLCVRHGGSVLHWLSNFSIAELVQHLPRPSLRAIGLIVGWSLFQAALLALLPGRTHLGPVTPAGERPHYELNGVPAWAVTHILLFVGIAIGLIDCDAFYRQFGQMLASLTLVAFGLCLLLYWKGFHAPSSRDAVTTRSRVFDFFQGVELHPRLFGLSLKQLINCRISMMGWSAIAVLFAGRQWQLTGSVSWAMAASVLILLVYLLKFFVWEAGYFGSLDITHDRFGYYICWGVLVWVPAIYNLPQLYLLHRPGDISPAAAIAIVIFGWICVWMNYAADRQRIRARATNGHTTIWGRPAEVLRASYTTADGVERENLLLVSGYWGVARHFHYLPELGVALAWCLPAGGTNILVPYFYFIFLTILLVDRARRDDLRCQTKYGATWAEYRRRVPWMILPGLY